MEEIGMLMGGLRVYVDNFVDKDWINIAKNGRIIKFNPDLVEDLKELIDKAKLNLQKKGDKK